MNGKSENPLRYLIKNQLAHYYANGITKRRFRNGLLSANRASRTRTIKNRSVEFERGYALTDAKRNILKRTMMTPETAYQRNKVTKVVGLVWVVCDYQN
jgi:hypothetical protein